MPRILTIDLGSEVAPSRATNRSVGRISVLIRHKNCNLQADLLKFYFSVDNKGKLKQIDSARTLMSNNNQYSDNKQTEWWRSVPSATISLATTAWRL